jgi:glyoxylase-like metal-dependent hydrolase (beta-lactamase superfamily II)
MSVLAVEQIADEPPEQGELLQVAEGIYWLRMPLPLALNHINLYLIDEGDSWSLLDTGMNTQATKDCWQMLFDKYFVDKPLKQVVVTHMHPDHVGLAGWLCERWRCPMYMTQVEYFAVRAYTANTPVTWQSERFCRQAGLSEDYIEFMHNRQPFGNLVSPMPGAYVQLLEDQEIILGGDSWQVIIGGGHSFAHACLYNAGKKLLLAGDQVLPRISSNVGVTATEPNASPLHDWYASLRRLKKLDENTLVLPAHNKPFTGLHQRADEIIEHHEKQLLLVLKECQTWKKPVELLKPMFGRDIGNYEMSLAVGECKAHLHMLLDRKQIELKMDNGVEYYQSLVRVNDVVVPELPRESFQV